MIDFRLCTGPVVNKLDAFSGNVQRALKQHYGTSMYITHWNGHLFPMSKPLSERGQFYKYISLDGTSNHAPSTNTPDHLQARQSLAQFGMGRFT